MAKIYLSNGTIFQEMLIAPAYHTHDFEDIVTGSIDFNTQNKVHIKENGKNLLETSGSNTLTLGNGDITKTNLKGNVSIPTGKKYQINGVDLFKVLTNAEYVAITTKEENTIYFIK